MGHGQPPAIVPTHAVRTVHRRHSWNDEAKFFLTASAEVRAERRHRELVARGLSTSFESVLRDQEQRDHDDSTRAIAPLKQAADAILIDSTRIDLEHVVDRIAAVLRERKLIP